VLTCVPRSGWFAERARCIVFPVVRLNSTLCLVVIGAIFFASCGGGGPHSTNAPPGFGATAPAAGSIVLTPVVNGLNNPVDLQQPNDNSSRLFVVEQPGDIRVISNGAVLATPFLDIRSQVTFGGEMGLLGMAFHPEFAQNHLFYVHYDRTVAGKRQSVIAEYHVSASDANRADPASERILLTVDQPYNNHKGGQLAFGPDGFLYIGLGDGGSEGDPLGNGQNKNTLLGKVLRIDVNSTSPGRQYGIPPDNPFASGGGAPEIFAYGFRNPWRMSFDRTSGTLFAGDVGENKYEEVDIVDRGNNYGWNIMEGFHCFNPPSGCNTSGLTMPIAEYSHSEGDAIIGGYVYHGTKIPGLQGAYIFGDFGTGKIWELTQDSSGSWTRTQLLDTGRNISSFGQDQAGEVYVVDLAGAVLQLASR
jgi:glucose/arabinose dehydrogenase